MNNKKHSKMIRERAEKRGRYEKHYETEDHGCAVAVYPEAVHFFEDGEWKEIDNTLVEDGSGGYVNRASDMKVRFAGETGDGALVSIRKDGYEIRWELLKDAEKAENAEKAEHAGKAEHAEKAERPEGAEAAELAEDLKIEAVNVAAEETRHHFEPAAIIRRFKDRDEAADTSADPKQTTDPEDTDSKQTAKSVNGDMDEDVELHNLKRMTLGGGRSGGTYHEIFPGVDLEYRLEGDRLKENIILKTAEALKERVSFVLTHPGLQLGREQDGSLILYPEGKEQEPVFFLDAPYLYDVAGAVSAAVQYRVEEMEQGEGAKTGKTIVTLVSDRVWLESPERVLPVTIDPNVKASKKSTTIDDAFVCSARPDSAEAANYRELEVGRNSVNQYCRSFLKFNQLPELEKGAVVVGAYFNLWQYKYSANSGAAINIAAHRVTGSWSEASVTWNTQPSFESAAMDYKSIGALGTNQWMGLDLM